MANIRPFQIPQDLDNLLQLIKDGFQYPENPDWNIQEDEKESMLDSLHSIWRHCHCSSSSKYLHLSKKM